MDWTDDDAEEDEERGCRLVPRPERVSSLSIRVLTYYNLITARGYY